MKALVCSTRLPEYDRECGSKRVSDLVQFLMEADWAVTYVARQAEPTDRHARVLRQAGVATHVGLETLSREFFAKGGFDLAILAFWHLANECLEKLRRWSPETRIIVDSIDLHFLRNARGLIRRARALSSAGGLDGHFGDELVRELNTYAAADAVLAVSQKEAALIGDLIGDPEAACWVPLCEELPRSSVPFAERQGLLFVGNFWHQPNVEAAGFLANEILPRVDPSLLARHPLRIVGNASADHARRFAANPSIHVVGWVPSLLPYLSRARVATVPLLHGAGTKGKLIQSLMVGTPVVSTTVGVEGLNVAHERDLLVADDPGGFAAGIDQLLTNDGLWSELADQGRSRVMEVHGREVVRRGFLEAVQRVLSRPSKRVNDFESLPVRASAYTRFCQRVRAAVERTVRAGATVMVISKGDEDLVTLQDRRGEHFPQLPDGRFAGSYPADGTSAVEEVKRLRDRGAEFLVIPRTASWWLDYYTELRGYLDRDGQLLLADEDCRIYGFGSPAATAPASSQAPSTRETRTVMPLPRAFDATRPRIAAKWKAPSFRVSRPRVLVLGIYLVGQLNSAADEAAILRATEHFDVDQRWVALGGGPSPEIADLTVRSLVQQTPKFKILNDLLAGMDLSPYEYLMVLDDDVILPRGFADALFTLQRQLGFALAQPARTSDSYYDHPIVEQQRGVLARQTMFVEIGPAFSLHRSIFDLLLPFDLTSSMGWGYENVWAQRVSERGLKIGIIDAVPVAHNLRKSVMNYDWDAADAERHAYLSKHRHLDLDECFRVIDVIGLDGG